MNEQEKRLSEAILSDARAQAEQIVAEAEAEAERMASETKSAVAKMREDAMRDASAAVAMASRKSSAGVDMEIGRMWLRRQESAIEQLLSEALAEAEGAEGSRRESSLAALAREAFRALGPGRYEVRVGGVDSGVVTPSWVESQACTALGSACGVICERVISDAGVKGGLVIVSSDGRRTFDNTYSVRLSRMRDGLRLLAVNG